MLNRLTKGLYICMSIDSTRWRKQQHPIVRHLITPGPERPSGVATRASISSGIISHPNQSEFVFRVRQAVGADEDNLPDITADQRKQIFFEKYVCPMLEDENQKFQEKMQWIIKRLNTNHDFTKEPIEFVLDNRDFQNAYYINLDGKHLIGISAKMLEDESLLYWVLGHEYGHLRAQAKGIQENSKFEEAFSDLHLLERIEELGLDATVAERFFTSEKPFDLDNVLIQAAIDVHPLDGTRQGLIETYLGVICSLHGGLNIDKNTLNVNNPEYQDFKNFAEGIFKRDKTDTISFNKTKKINDIFTNIEKKKKELLHSAGSAKDKQKLIDELLIELTRIDMNALSTQNNSADIYKKIAQELNQTVEFIAENYDEIYQNQKSKTLNSLFSSTGILSERLEIEFDPLGMRAIMRDFVTAKDPTTISAKAEVFQEKIKKSRLFFQSLDYYHFDREVFKINNHNELPWEAHIKELDNDNVLLTLIDLGVFDNRLIDHIGIIPYSRLIDSAITNSNFDDYKIHIPNNDGTPSDIFRSYYVSRDQILNFKDLYRSEIYIQRANIIDARINELIDSLFTKSKDENYDDYKKELKALLAIKNNLLISDSPLGDELISKITFELVGLDCAEKNLDLFFEINNHPSIFSYCYESLKTKLDNLLKVGNSKTYFRIFTEILQLREIDDRSQRGTSFVLTTSILNNPSVWEDHPDKTRFIQKLNLFSYQASEKEPNWQDESAYAEISIDSGYLDRIRELYNLDDVVTSTALLDRLVAISNISNNDLEANKFCGIWACAEVCEYIDLCHDDEDFNIDLSTIILALPQESFIESERLESLLSPLITNYDFSNLDVEQKISVLNKISKAKYKNIEEAEDRLVQQIIEGMKSTEDTQKQLILLEKLMAIPAATNWTTTRQALTILWIQAVVTESQNDEKKVYNHAKSISKSLNISHYNELVTSLADRYSSQKELSYQLRDLITDNTLTITSRTKTTEIGIIESIKYLANKDVQVRDALTDLLYENNKRNQKKLETSLNEAINRQSRLRLFHGNLDLKTFLKMSSFQKQRFYDIFHDNFWNSPLYARAAFVKDVMCPYDSDTSVQDQIFYGSARYVLNKLINPNSQNAIEIRNLIIDFCNVLSKRERALFIAAIFSASKNITDERDEDNSGKRLAVLLSNMGPAWIKLGQAIHSYDKTPEVLRNDLEMMKLDIDAPTRWQLFEQIEKTIPESLRSRIVNVGERLGSASYYYVYKVTLDDGKDYALALLKPSAKARSQYGFEQMENLVKQIAKRKKEEKEYQSSLRDLVTETKTMAGIETDNKNAHLQERIAIENNANTTITVGKVSFDIDIARNIETGDGYRLMELAEGETFNQLYKKDKSYKSFGLGYHTHQLINMLSGNYFDEDTHGGQLKIKGKTAKLFDFGATKITAKPSDDELLFVGKLFAQLYTRIKDSKNPGDLSKSLSEAFIAAIAAYRDSGKQNTGYLTSLHKNWVALADFRRDFTKDDYQDMFITTLKSKRISKKIIEGITGELNINLYAFKIGLQAQRNTISFSKTS